jgi:NAD(P)-dependent dehydrogenase (short-subunit alcohol dehydrogenase family)
MQTLLGKVALVTGGGSGIGRATALAFAKGGAKVVVAGRRVAEGEETVRLVLEHTSNAIFVQTDVTKAKSIEELMAAILEEYGHLDHAFNCAGIEGGLGPITELSEEEWDKTINTNLKGTWLSMRAEIPMMLQNGGGSIVNISSFAGVVGMPGSTIYAASENGVIGLTRAAAIEYARSGIRINSVTPGPVDTAMMDRFVGGSARAKAQLAAGTAIGRAGKPEEIASAVLWLAADTASFVTGHNLVVDGGYTVQ